MGIYKSPSATCSHEVGKAISLNFFYSQVENCISEWWRIRQLIWTGRCKDGGFVDARRHAHCQSIYKTRTNTSNGPGGVFAFVSLVFLVSNLRGPKAFILGLKLPLSTNPPGPDETSSSEDLHHWGATAFPVSRSTSNFLGDGRNFRDGQAKALMLKVRLPLLLLGFASESRRQ